MEKIQMKSKKNYWYIIIFFVLFINKTAYAHDTTHIHPLITAKIAELIKRTDDVGKNYIDIYKSVEDPIYGLPPGEERLYWGTDHDIIGLSVAPDKVKYLMKDQQKPYKDYNNVIDGVVQEDVPGGKVTDHFYHATTGIGLKIDSVLTPDGKPSAVVAMKFFNESIKRMGGYTEDAKHTAFFEFGHALHHVEDMSSPAHIHNDPHLTFSK